MDWIEHSTPEGILIDRVFVDGVRQSRVVRFRAGEVQRYADKDYVLETVSGDVTFTLKETSRVMASLAGAKLRAMPGYRPQDDDGTITPQSMTVAAPGQCTITATRRPT